MTFTQRISAPTGTEKYWLRPEAGGLNLCLKIRDNGSVIPNCTGYAYGRFMEEALLISCNLSRANAENWYDNKDGYPRGTAPKLGAVMCWRGGSTQTSADGYGHVAIVEQINPDGSVVCSMSNYPMVVSGKTLPFWERKTYYPPYNTSTGLIFQGFIYNPALDAEPLKIGMNEREINGIKLSVYRVAEGLKIGLIRAQGLQKIRKIDMDGIYVYEKSGNSFFQMLPNQADPVGTVYGPRVCIDGHYDMPVNSEDFLYYMIKKDGTVEFGDWNGAWRDPSDIQYMISPGVIFYLTDTGERKIKYAPKMASYTAAHWQSYLARTVNGTILKGVSKGMLTPEQIFNFLRLNYDVREVCFMDGGSSKENPGSAQQCYWNGSEMVDYQDNDRAVGDITAVYLEKPGMIPYPTEDPVEEQAESEQENPVSSEQTIAEDPAETPAEETPVNETAEPDPAVIIKDPEGGLDMEYAPKIKVEIADKIMSLVTIIFTLTFCYREFFGLAVSDEFMRIYMIILTTFFTSKTASAITKNNDTDQKGGR